TAPTVRSFEKATDPIPGCRFILDCSEQSNIVRLAVMIDSSPRPSQNILVCQRTPIPAWATAAGVDAAHRLILHHNGDNMIERSASRHSHTDALRMRLITGGQWTCQ